MNIFKHSLILFLAMAGTAYSMEKLNTNGNYLDNDPASDFFAEFTENRTFYNQEPIVGKIITEHGTLEMEFIQAPFNFDECIAQNKAPEQADAYSQEEDDFFAQVWNSNTFCENDPYKDDYNFDLLAAQNNEQETNEPTSSGLLSTNSDERSNSELLQKNIPKQIGCLIRRNDPRHPIHKKIEIEKKSINANDSQKSIKKRILENILNQGESKSAKKAKKTKIPCSYCEKKFSIGLTTKSIQYQSYLVHIYKEKHKPLSSEIEKCINNAHRENGIATATCPGCKWQIKAKENDISDAVIRHYYGSAKHNKEEVEKTKNYLKSYLEDK